jgi:hypothetical protein
MQPSNAQHPGAAGTAAGATRFNQGNGVKNSQQAARAQHRRRLPTLIEEAWRFPVDRLLGELDRYQRDKATIGYGVERIRRNLALLDGLTEQEAVALARLLGKPVMRRKLAAVGTEL